MCRPLNPTNSIRKKANLSLVGLAFLFSDDPNTSKLIFVKFCYRLIPTVRSETRTPTNTREPKMKPIPIFFGIIPPRKTDHHLLTSRKVPCESF